MKIRERVRRYLAVMLCMIMVLDNTDTFSFVKAAEEATGTINLLGAVKWEGDEYWKEYIRPEKSVDLTIYKVSQDGTKKTLNQGDYPISWYKREDGHGTLGYKLLKVPALLEGEYYAVEQKNLPSYQETEVVSGAVVKTDGTLEFPDLVNTLETKEVKVESVVRGQSSSTAKFTYGITAGKDDKNQKEFHGNYKIGENGTVTSTNTGKVEVSADKDLVLQVPASLQCEVVPKTEGYVVDKKVSDDGNTITFSYINSNVTCAITKVWNDNHAQDRPTDITLSLCYQFVDDAGKALTTPSAITPENIEKLGLEKLPELKSEKLSASQTKYSYTGLPSCANYEGELTAIKYSIVEAPMDNYVGTETIKDGETILTNTRVQDFHVTIEWNDGKDEKRPNLEDVKLGLYGYKKKISDGKEIDLSSLKEDQVVIEQGENEWEVTIKDLPVYAEDGYPYTYYMEEEQPKLQGTSSEDNYAPVEYKNDGNEHAMVTDRCFEGGTIVNTKVGTTEFHVNYVWKGEEDRPAGDIYLWRYSKGESVSQAAIVKTGAGDEMSFVKQPIATGAAVDTKMELTFLNLDKYDEHGKEYIYLAKAVLDGNNYVYVYPDNNDYGAKEKEDILLRPNAVIDAQYSATWFTGAYPKAPEGWKILVKVQKTKKGTDNWEDVKDEQYQDLYFDGFTPETLTRDMKLTFSRYDNEGNELEYRIQPVQLEKEENGKNTVVTPEKEEDKILFKINDGKQQYEMEIDEKGNIVNRLYGELEYVVRKYWKDENGSNDVTMYKTEGAYAQMKLSDAAGDVKDIGDKECTYKLEAKEEDIVMGKNNEPVYWEHTFTIDRFDELGYEKEITASETTFSPRSKEIGSETKTYATKIDYSRPNDNTMIATCINYIPGDGKYMAIQKVWIDGKDFEEREPVVAHLYKYNDTEKKYEIVTEKDSIEPKKINLTEQNNWYQEIEIDGEASQYKVVEYSVGGTLVEYTLDIKNALETIVLGGPKGTVITSKHRYEVTNALAGNKWTITNQRVGKVYVNNEIVWQDGGIGDHRPDIDSEMYQKTHKGEWTKITDDNAKITITKIDVSTDASIWVKRFEGYYDKYDDEGYLINYKSDISGISYTNGDEDVYVQTAEENAYTSHEIENSMEESVYSDEVRNIYTFTKTGYKNIKVYKHWQTDGGAQPDLYLTLLRATKTVDQAGNTHISEPEPYDAKETAYGKIEMVWTKNGADKETCEIRNLEKTDEEGRLYVYYVHENMSRPGDYKAYYFENQAAEDNWIRYGMVTSEDASTLAKDYVCEEGIVYNRIEGELKIVGSKLWKNLESGTTVAQLPEPVITIRRYTGDKNNKIQDTAFNNKNHSVTLTEKYGKNKFEFPADNSYTLPKYSAKGEKYTYYLSEDLGKAANAYYTTELDDFALVNEYKTGPENTRTIKVTKNWSSFYTDTKQYPDVTYELYRYEQTVEVVDGKDTYKKVEVAADKDKPIAEITLQGGDADGKQEKTSEGAFTDLRVVSPKGIPYLYVVKEKAVNGYLIDPDSTKGEDVSVYTYEDNDTNCIKSVKVVPMGTVDQNGKLDKPTETVGIEYGNKYIGTSHVYITGSKKWNDEGYEYLRKNPNYSAYASGDDASKTFLRTQQDIALQVWRWSDGAYGVKAENITGRCDIKWTDKDAKELKDSDDDNELHTWYYTITAKDGQKDALLRYAPNGEPYKYKVIELPHPYYNQEKETTAFIDSTKYDENEKKDHVAMKPLTNSMSTSLTVQKVWDDGGNKYGLRPSNVTVKLQRRMVKDDPIAKGDLTANGDVNWEDVLTTKDGKTVSATAILSTANNWSYTFTELPTKSNEELPDGSSVEDLIYQYRAVEIKIGDTPTSDCGAYTAEHKWEEGKTTITNSIKAVSLKVTKKWVGDQNDRYNTRNKTADGKPWQVKVKIQRKEKPETGNGYDSEDGWNDLTIGATQIISGTSEEDSASVIFSDLPSCDLSGKPYLYRAVEVDPQKNYEVSTNTLIPDAIEVGGTKFETTITNTLKKDANKSSVTVNKTWYSETKLPVEVELLQSTDGINFATWKPAQKVTLGKTPIDWTYTWEGLPEVDKDGNKITYKVRENLTEEQQKRWNKAETTTGSAIATSGARDYQITNTELIDYYLDVTWKNNTYGLTNKATFELQRKLATQEDSAYVTCPDTLNPGIERTGDLNKDKNTRYTWEKLPKYDENGNLYQYRVVETTIGGTSILGDYKTYTVKTTHNNTVKEEAVSETQPRELYGSTIVNEPQVVEVSGTKVWNYDELNDGLAKEGIQPEDFTRKLQYKKASTAEEYQEVAKTPEVESADFTMTKKDGDTWTYTYKNLPKYDLTGNEIAYQVVEVVPTNYPYTYAFEKTSTGSAITNTLQTVGINITKTWDDYQNRYELRPNELPLEVYETGVKMNPQPSIVWNEATDPDNKKLDTWTYEIKGLPKFVWDATAKAYREAVYTVKEICPQEYNPKCEEATKANEYKLENEPVIIIVLLNTDKTGEEEKDFHYLKGGEFSLSGEFKIVTSGAVETRTEENPIKLELENGRLHMLPKDLGGYGFIPGNEYVITQTKAEPGYQTMVEEIKFYVDSDGMVRISDNSAIASNDLDDAGVGIPKKNGRPVALRIKNIKTKASISFTKTDSENKALQGVTFDLYQQSRDSADLDNDTKLKTDLTTDTDGKIKVEDLGEGKYYFVETKTLDQYYLDQTNNKYFFEVTNGDHNKEVKLNGTAADAANQIQNVNFQAKVTFVKLDAEGVKIAGTTFKLTGTTKDGRKVEEEYSTDADGKVEISLDAKGTYTLQETKASKGYKQAAEGKEFKCTFKVTDQQQGKTLQLNQQYLTDENTDKFAVKIDETIADQYLKVGEKVGIYNERIPGKVILNKVDAEDNTKGINNAEFTLEKKNVTNIYESIKNFFTGHQYDIVEEQLTTDEDGKLVIKGLPWGSYRITETKAADGYLLSNPAPSQEFVINAETAGDGLYLTYDAGEITNQRIKVSIGAEENANEQQQKPNVNLQISEILANGETNALDSWTTGTEEKEFDATFAVGKHYSITQPECPEGYEPWNVSSGGAIEFHIDADGKIVIDKNLVAKDGKPIAEVTEDGKTIYVRNLKVYGAVELSKTGKNNMPLKDVTFALYDDKDQLLADDIVTDADGKWCSWDKEEYQTLLPVGKYYFKETMKVGGYKPALEQKFEFEITPEDYYNETREQLVTCAVENQPITLQIGGNFGVGENSYWITGHFIPENADPNDPEQTLKFDNLEDLAGKLVEGEEYEIKIGSEDAEDADTIRVSVNGNGEVILEISEKYEQSEADGTIVLKATPTPIPTQVPTPEPTEEVVEVVGPTNLPQQLPTPKPIETADAEVEQTVGPFDLPVETATVAPEQTVGPFDLPVATATVVPEKTDNLFDFLPIATAEPEQTVGSIATAEPEQTVGSIATDEPQQIGPLAISTATAKPVAGEKQETKRTPRPSRTARPDVMNAVHQDGDKDFVVNDDEGQIAKKKKTKKKASNPKTGDTSRPWFWFIMFAMSGCITIVTGIKRKTMKKK